MWFWLSLIALLCWSGSDLFSKIGCQGEDDHLAHLKMVIAVGTVMGLHAAFEIFIGGTEISWSIIWTYLPVSLLYIGSMTLGYLGLRYIELSVSSPICNSSGALVAVMTLLFVGGEDYSPLALGAVSYTHLHRSYGSDWTERYARGGSCCRCDKRRGRRRAVQRAAGKSPRSGSPLDLSNKRCGASRTVIHI